MAAAVDAYGGYVAQHLGDGAVAYFGWPEARENRRRARRARVTRDHCGRRGSVPG